VFEKRAPALLDNLAGGKFQAFKLSGWIS